MVEVVANVAVVVAVVVLLAVLELLLLVVPVAVVELGVVDKVMAVVVRALEDGERVELSDVVLKAVVVVGASVVVVVVVVDVEVDIVGTVRFCRGLQVQLSALARYCSRTVVLFDSRIGRGGGHGTSGPVTTFKFSRKVAEELEALSVDTGVRVDVTAVVVVAPVVVVGKNVPDVVGAAVVPCTMFQGSVAHSLPYFQLHRSVQFVPFTFPKTVEF